MRFMGGLVTEILVLDGIAQLHHNQSSLEIRLGLEFRMPKRWRWFVDKVTEFFI